MIRIAAIALLFLFIISCSPNDDVIVWYGASDRIGFILACEEKKDAWLFAYLPLSIVASYRSSLAALGIPSDTLGALQSLFGMPGDYYLKGSETQWQTVRALFGTNKEPDELFYLLQASAGDLSKEKLFNTVGQLAGPGTTEKDIRRLIRRLTKSKSKAAVYDMGSFFSLEMDSELLRQWITTWTVYAIREAAR